MIEHASLSKANTLLPKDSTYIAMPKTGIQVGDGWNEVRIGKKREDHLLLRHHAPWLTSHRKAMTPDRVALIEHLTKYCTGPTKHSES
jgi:hypothetical protein